MDGREKACAFARPGVVTCQASSGYKQAALRQSQNEAFERRVHTERGCRSILGRVRVVIEIVDAESVRSLRFKSGERVIRCCRAPDVHLADRSAVDLDTHLRPDAESDRTVGFDDELESRKTLIENHGWCREEGGGSLVKQYQSYPVAGALTATFARL